jgi:hypothetical protein
MAGSYQKPVSRLVLPLPRQRILFIGVAFFTGRDKVTFCGFAATHEGNKMVHGQLFGRKVTLAIITDSGPTLPLPPFRAP